MENTNEYAINKLNHLVNIAEDGKEGYENAAENVEDSAIKSSFMLFAKSRSVYASQLREIINQLHGESEDTGGGSVGSLHRVWMDLKSTFTGGDTDAIINVCITGEEAAIKEYKLVLDDTQMLKSPRPILEKQLSGIEQALVSIKSHVHEAV